MLKKAKSVAKIAIAPLVTMLLCSNFFTVQSQSNPWRVNQKMAGKQIVTGTHTEQIYVFVSSGSGYYSPITVTDYATIQCCTQATDSDACNTSAQDRRCSGSNTTPPPKTPPKNPD